MLIKKPVMKGNQIKGKFNKQQHYTPKNYRNNDEENKILRKIKQINTNEIIIWTKHPTFSLMFSL